MAEPHVVYFALGSNLGDRQSNLIEAIQSLRANVQVERISSVYKSRTPDGPDQPPTLNVVVKGVTALEPHELLRFAQRIERRLGRVRDKPHRTYPIDIDLLAYDDRVITSGDLRLPHPRLAQRAVALAPLDEIAPDWLHPARQQTARQLLEALGGPDGVTRVARGLTARLDRDVQEERPPALLRLDRVGVTGLQRVIRLSTVKGQLYHAHLNLSVELGPEQKGAHMSRFSDTVEEVLDEFASAETPTFESLADRVARQLVTGQRARRADVEVRAHFPLSKHAPLSGKLSQEIYTLIGIASATPGRSISIIGVEAEGMMACPCAQDMVRSAARERLLEDGFAEETADRMLDLVPLATHNQRGRGTLMVGLPYPLRPADPPVVRAQDLVEIIEASMSSENYDLLKRPDELFVVQKAHRHPRFVEDAVREMLCNFVEMYPDLPDTSYVSARQVNMETIHKHDVFAERGGTLAELRAELRSGVSRKTSLETWLGQQIDGTGPG
ncbi:MAG TPA: GTP cyclohydrolase MptA [Anaerolineae bacterium]|nr:GTP cyclohydrolase MptA [Anaerolineae bacterium]